MPLVIHLDKLFLCHSRFRKGGIIVYENGFECNWISYFNKKRPCPRTESKGRGRLI